MYYLKWYESLNRLFSVILLSNIFTNLSFDKPSIYNELKKLIEVNKLILRNVKFTYKDPILDPLVNVGIITEIKCSSILHENGSLK